MPNSAPEQPDLQFATTLAKGLDILRCFTPDEPILSNKQLAQKTGLSKPTVSRFTYTLIKLGYLTINRDTNRYRLGSAVLSLGYPLLAGLAIRQAARGPINELARKFDCSVSMGIRDRLNIVYIETSRGSSLLSPQFSDVGRTTPIIGSAIGGAYFAACSTKEYETIANELKVKQPTLWEAYEGDALQHLKEYKEHGFCLNTQGRHGENVLAVGVPLSRTFDGEKIVFNCVVANTDMRFDLKTEIGPALRVMVQSLEFNLRSY